VRDIQGNVPATVPRNGGSFWQTVECRGYLIKGGGPTPPGLNKKVKDEIMNEKRGDGTFDSPISVNK